VSVTAAFCIDRERGGRDHEAGVLGHGGACRRCLITTVPVVAVIDPRATVEASRMVTTVPVPVATMLPSRSIAAVGVDRQRATTRIDRREGSLDHAHTSQRDRSRRGAHPGSHVQGGRGGDRHVAAAIRRHGMGQRDRPGRVADRNIAVAAARGDGTAGR